MTAYVPQPIKQTATPMPQEEVSAMNRRQLVRALREQFNAELDLWTDPIVDESVTFNYTRFANQAMKQSLIDGKLHPRLVVHELGWGIEQLKALEARGLTR